MRTIDEVLKLVCDFMNKRRIKLDDTTINLASPEDTIANKLLFAREQDLEDSLGIYVRGRYERYEKQK